MTAFNKVSLVPRGSLAQQVALMRTDLNTLIANLNNGLSNTRNKPSIIGERVMLWNSAPAPTATTATYRQVSRSPANYSVSGLQLLYTNWNMAGNPVTETDNADTITVKAAIDVGNIVYPVYFNGLRIATLLPGATVLSDPLPIDLAPGTQFFTRTFVSTTGVYPQSNSPVLQSSRGEGVTQATDLTGSGAVAVTAINTNFYGPSAILGLTGYSRQLSIALLGDSTVRGANSIQDADANSSTYSRWCGNLTGYVNFGCDSDRAVTVAVQENRRRRFQMLAMCNPTHAVLQLGINDVGNGQTDDQLRANLLIIGDAIARLGILPIIACTTPHSSSVDGWISVAGQTVLSSTGRTANNDWRRTLPAPFVAVLDPNTYFESSYNSGLWTPSSTIDGLHPGSAGITGFQALFGDPNLFFNAVPAQ
jgi:lysophospholipase L1-like esterase